MSQHNSGVYFRPAGFDVTRMLAEFMPLRSFNLYDTSFLSWRIVLSSRRTVCLLRQEVEVQHKRAAHMSTAARLSTNPQSAQFKLLSENSFIIKRFVSILDLSSPRHLLISRISRNRNVKSHARLPTQCNGQSPFTTRHDKRHRYGDCASRFAFKPRSGR